VHRKLLKLMTDKTLQKKLLTHGSIICALAVAFGAFASHGLKNKITAENLSIFETGIKYQFYHGIAILSLYGMQRRLHEQTIKIVFYLLLIGIIVFSGSLLLLSTRELTMGETLKPLGLITPLGGLSLITAWGYLAFKGYKPSKSSRSSSSKNKQSDSNAA
jgi:uncharacterized membrane protein YgdD (TMEM256/DUF423 family)